MTNHKTNTMETLAQSSLPVPVGVSGMTLLGVTVQDWVLIGTAILLVFQIVVIAPKVANTVKSIFKRGES